MVAVKVLYASLLFALSAFMPCESVRRRCVYKDAARDLLLHGDVIVVTRPARKEIIVINPHDLETMRTIQIPGNLCGGSCYPFSVAIKEDENVLAVAAKTQLSGGNNKILFFKINGRSILSSSIDHYYTMPDSMLSGVYWNSNSPDIRSIAFCGGRFAFAYYYGRIKNFKMLAPLYYGYVSGKPMPNLDKRVNWNLDSLLSRYNDYGRTEYLRCSNNGSYWLIGKDTTQYYSYDKVAAVPSTIDSSSNNIFQQATISFDSSILHAAPRFALTQVRGLAMDNGGNFYFASGDGKFYSNTNYGFYVRSPSGTARPIMEWQTPVEIFGIAATNQQVVYTAEKHGTNTNYICRHDNL